MNKIVKFIKENRKAAGLTQEEFAMRSGLGLRFVRELEHPVNIIIPEDKERFALAINGKMNIRRKDFKKNRNLGFGSFFVETQNFVDKETIAC